MIACQRLWSTWRTGQRQTYLTGSLPIIPTKIKALAVNSSFPGAFSFPSQAFHLCGIPAICFSSPGSAPALLGWLSAPLAVTSATTATSPPPLCSGFESTQKHTAGAAQCVSGCNSCGTSVPPTPRSPPLLWRSLHLNAMAALAAGTDNSPGCRHGQQPWLPARSTALAAGMANSPDNLTQPFCCQPVTIGTTSVVALMSTKTSGLGHHVAVHVGKQIRR
ncbi:hypothetical protein CLOM_g7627 [Closterium sp. NIES-68]|nr:hypothetical protein CLOM_g7627 [Closterium sp. NIES-68]GJP65834.1 hypothetical protein CLOP_g22745 [Closterium sp. NIES-67]